MIQYLDTAEGIAEVAEGNSNAMPVIRNGEVED